MVQKFHDSIELCWEARHACQRTLFTHCLPIGGMHMEENHVRLMVDCIEICQTTADFMTRHSTYSASIGKSCAEVCDACAVACEKIGDEAMMKCAEACRACAKSCRDMIKD